ncbi:MAG: hypothetical protein GY719_23140, partial [bacterium]|nr:hypothetical protein [bacterium]
MAKIVGFEKIPKCPDIVKQGYEKPFDPIGGLIRPLFHHKYNKNKTPKSADFCQKIKCKLRENYEKSSKSGGFEKTQKRPEIERQSYEK